MRNIDVLFLVEHVSRELDIATCLVHMLWDRYGIQANVKNYYLDFEDTLHKQNPKVLVFPFFYGADHLFPIKYLAKWPQCSFLNFGWEQILMKVDLSMKVPRDDQSRQAVKHICWTQDHLAFLRDNGVVAENLILSGSPVLKLYDAPYRNYFPDRRQLGARYSIDPQRKWVLFPEAYQFAFLAEEQLQFLATHQNANMALMRAAKSYSIASLQTLLRWVKELNRDDDPLFILRPRPSTSAKQLVEFVKETIGDPGPNIAIIKGGSVREWILSSDQVMSSHSTTLIEAAIAGKPIHLFSPSLLPDALQANWHELVPAVHDRQSTLAALREDRCEATALPLETWARQKFLSCTDPLSTIAAAIAAHCSSIRQQADTPDFKRLFGARVMRGWLRQRRHRSNLDFFDAHQVAVRVKNWSRVLS